MIVLGGTNFDQLSIEREVEHPSERRYSANIDSDLAELNNPELELVSFVPENFQAYSSALPQIIKKFCNNYSVTIRGDYEQVHQKLNERFLGSSESFSLPEELISDILRIIDLGLKMPGKTQAEVIIEKVAGYPESNTEKFFFFHFDTTKSERSSGLPFRCFQTLHGTPGCYILSDEYQRSDAYQYLNERSVEYQHVNRRALSTRGVNLSIPENRINLVDSKLIKYDHNSSFFKSFDHSKVKFLDQGEACFFREEHINHRLNGQGLPGLGHFFPIGTERLRLIYDFR